MNRSRSLLSSGELNALTKRVIGCAIAVHRELGPGLLESVYEACLAYELEGAGVSFERQLLQPVVYRGVTLDETYRVDLFVEEALVVEVKAVSKLHPVHEAQLLTYLKLLDAPLGLVLNFNVPVLRSGLRRLVNRFPF